MNVATHETTTAHDGHVVHFYEHDAELVDAVCPYLAEAVGAGEVAIMIATAAHRRAFEDELEARGVDLERARADGLLVSLDADATLAAFSDGGHLDQSGFREVIGGLIRDASAGGRGARAYGEMVALLWDRGEVLAAIELEGLWNELGRELSFSLLCSYACASVAGSEHAGVSASFPAEPDSPAHARRMAAATLRRWGCDDPLVDDVSLVVSELASNAVRHAGSSFSLALQLRGPLLRVAVEDSAPLPDAGLAPRPPHGLCVVDSLSAAWGVEPTRHGKVVWARLPCAVTARD